MRSHLDDDGAPRRDATLNLNIVLHRVPSSPPLPPSPPPNETIRVEVFKRANGLISGHAVFLPPAACPLENASCPLG